jgi:signal transduction histidine kinase/FixJ family two-component response regulator
VTGAKKQQRSVAETPDAISARRRLRGYFLAAALAPPAVALLVAAATHTARHGAVWLVLCLAAGVLTAVAATAFAMRRVVLPLHGIAEGLWKSASNADRMKSTFLANMSHEIRTPLNSVLALSHLLRESVAGPLTSEQRRYLEIITRNGQSLLHLIDDILDLSRIEAGHVELDTEDIDLAGPIAGIVDALAPLATAKDLDVTVKLPDDMPRVRCDVDRVRQILTNLIANAIKFTDAGMVRVTATASGAVVAIHVTDTGIGIPEDQLGHIFEEFVQVDQTLARRKGGAGLGLAIASRLARLMGGAITASSVPGSGSRFTVTLPRAAERSEKPNVSRLSATVDDTVEDIRAQAYAPDAGRGLTTVLIVEDNEDNLFTLRAVLAPLSFRIAAATTGRQAIESCRAEMPDLVIMDVQMPGMSGLQATGAIRALPGGRDVPILALTAQAMAGDRERILAAGVDAYLPKPVPPRELRATVGRLLQSRHPHSHAASASTQSKKEDRNGAHSPRR